MSIKSASGLNRSSSRLFLNFRAVERKTCPTNSIFSLPTRALIDRRFNFHDYFADIGDLKNDYRLSGKGRSCIKTTTAVGVP